MSPRDRVMAAAVLCVVTLLMLLNPWFYVACLFEFHLLAFAALFLVCVLSNAWRGKLGWASFWAGALLLTGDTGGLYLAGAGVSIAIASPTFRRRLAGVAALCIGCIWLAFVRAVAVKANTVLQGYTWLVTGTFGVSKNFSLWTLLKAIILHPHRQLQMIWAKRVHLYDVLIPTGVIGLISPWMWGTTAVTFYAMTLAAALTFLVDGFNLLAGFFVGAAATSMVLSFLISKRRAWINAGVGLLLVLMLGQSIALAVTQLPGIPSYWYRVSPVQASVLGEVLNETPGNAEVITSNGIMGRFSDRDFIFGLSAPDDIQGLEANCHLRLCAARGDRELQTKSNRGCNRVRRNHSSRGVPGEPRWHLRLLVAPWAERVFRRPSVSFAQCSPIRRACILGTGPIRLDDHRWLEPSRDDAD